MIAELHPEQQITEQSEFSIKLKSLDRQTLLFVELEIFELLELKIQLKEPPEIEDADDPLTQDVCEEITNESPHPQTPESRDDRTIEHSELLI